MKRKAFTVFFVACTLVIAAQNPIKVKYRGSKPTISDFAWAYLSSYNADDDECIDEATNAIKQTWIEHRKGIPLDKSEKLDIDERNGYVLYESRYENHLLRIEMCYWNEADRKHKLFAVSVWSFSDGKPNMGQFDGISFWRYNNATRKMVSCNTPGFEVQYNDTFYSLPRVGKDITVTSWDNRGKKRVKTLKWNGHWFSF